MPRIAATNAFDIVPVRRTIEPAQARQLLAKNSDVNRKLRPIWLKYLADQMVRGRWQLTPDAIATDEKGFLRNGQHRLHAAVMANLPIETFFVEGLSDAAFLVTDVGTKRTAADTLHVTNAMAADLVLVANILGKFVYNRTPTDELADILGWWGPITEDAVSVYRGGTGINNAPVRVGLLLRSAMHHAGEEREYIRAQTEAIMTNDAPSMSTAAATAWQRAIKSNSWQTRPKRVAMAAQIYYCLDPARRDQVPSVRTESAVEEMRKNLGALHAAAAIAAGKVVPKIEPKVEAPVTKPSRRKPWVPNPAYASA